MSSAAAGSETRVGRMNCLTSVTRIWEGRAARVWGCSTPTGLLVCWRRHDCTLWGEGGGTGALAHTRVGVCTQHPHMRSPWRVPTVRTKRNRGRRHSTTATAGPLRVREHRALGGGRTSAARSTPCQAVGPGVWRTATPYKCLPRRRGGLLSCHGTVRPEPDTAGCRSTVMLRFRACFSVRRRGWGACHPGLAAHLRLHVSRVSTARGVQRGIWVATLLACDADTPQRLATACMNSKMGQGVRLVTRAGSGGVCRQRRVLVLGRGCGAAP